MTNAIRIIGLDPGLRRTGWGVISVHGARLSWIAHGVIRPDEKAPFSERLLCLLDGVAAVLETYAPDEAAVEETFVNKDASATLKLGQARGIAMVVPALSRGLPGLSALTRSRLMWNRSASISRGLV